MQKFLKWANWYNPDGYTYPYKSRLTNNVTQLMQKMGEKKFQIFLDYEFKLSLNEYISGKSNEPLSNNEFIEGLKHYGITAICLSNANKWKSEIIKIVQLEGFDLKTKIHGFQLWVKSSN
jgi:hypothetical protein